LKRLARLSRYPSQHRKILHAVAIAPGCRFARARVLEILTDTDGLGRIKIHGAKSGPS
jgi:hypothetical protein